MVDELGNLKSNFIFFDQHESLTIYQGQLTIYQDNSHQH
jgi:hypothetical protein